MRASYHGKFALAAAVGMLVPLAVFTGYLLFARADWATMYPVLAALVLACFMGFLGTLWVLRELLVPVELTAEALRAYIDKRKVPDLPGSFPDTAGKLMEGTQYTLTQLHETISRLERVSDTDDLTGVYNRRAGEKRLTEEVARAERDLQSFQFAFLDINEFKLINDRFGTGAEGVLMDADRAMYAAKEASHRTGTSEVCYRNELELNVDPSRRGDAALAS